MSSAIAVRTSDVLLTGKARKSVDCMPLHPGERTEVEELLMMVYALMMRYPSQDALSDALKIGGSTNLYRWRKRTNRPRSEAIRSNIRELYAAHYGELSPENAIPPEIVMLIRSNQPFPAPENTSF